MLWYLNIVQIHFTISSRAQQLQNWIFYFPQDGLRWFSRHMVKAHGPCVKQPYIESEVLMIYLHYCQRRTACHAWIPTWYSTIPHEIWFSSIFDEKDIFAWHLWMKNQSYQQQQKGKKGEFSFKKMKSWHVYASNISLGKCRAPFHGYKVLVDLIIISSGGWGTYLTFHHKVCILNFDYTSLLMVGGP